MLGSQYTLRAAADEAVGLAGADRVNKGHSQHEANTHRQPKLKLRIWRRPWAYTRLALSRS